MTTKKWILAIILTSLVAVVVTIFAYRRFQDGAPVSGERVGALQSVVLGESREYSVYLPPEYDKDSTARYPVLYVLDGELQAAHTAETASLLASIGVIPPIIVVGIPGVDNNTRTRDYTPPGKWRNADASRFLSFLQTELIARIEAEYRAARPRMLAGWSRGGLFVLYSQVAAPPLFDGRFAHSPFVWSEEDGLAVTRFEEGLSAAAPAPAFLYLSLGDEEVQTTPPFRRVVRVLEKQAPPKLRWRADFSAGGDHNSNPRLSTPVGLCAMFAPNSGLTCRAVQR